MVAYSKETFFSDPILDIEVEVKSILRERSEWITFQIVYPYSILMQWIRESESSVSMGTLVAALLSV